MDAQPRLLQPTRLLDFTHPAIEAVVEERGWRQLPTFERIGAVYDFVRNEIAFGYNAGDELPASAVMADRIGQCNTKTFKLSLCSVSGFRCSATSRDTDSGHDFLEGCAVFDHLTIFRCQLC